MAIDSPDVKNMLVVKRSGKVKVLEDAIAESEFESFIFKLTGFIFNDISINNLLFFFFIFRDR